MTRERRVIVACCGGSYTGQLACRGAVRLAREGYGDLAGVAALAAGHGPGIEQVRAADDIGVIDGCETGCARAVLDLLGIEPGQYIVAADRDLRSTGYRGIPPGRRRGRLCRMGAGQCGLHPPEERAWC